MKICFYANPGWSHVARWAVALAGRGHEVTVVSRNRCGNMVGLQKKGIRFYHLSSDLKFPWLFNHVKELNRFISELRPDIVHIHNLEVSSAAWGLTGFSNIILSVYGMDIVRYGARRELSFKKYLLKKFALKKVKIVTAPSKFLAAAAIDYGKIHSSKVRIVPFGVDTDKFEAENKAVSAIVKIGVLKDLRKEYGFRYFVEAVSLLKARIDNFKVIIGGDGEGREELENYVKKLGLHEHIEFSGEIKQDNNMNFLKQFDIIVMPSLFESFGVVGLEAQSLKIPVVAVNTGGILETVNREAGIIVPPKNPEAMADALEDLIIDPQKRKLMGECGRKHVRNKFEWSECVDNMFYVYSSVLNSPSKAELFISELPDPLSDTNL